MIRSQEEVEQAISRFTEADWARLRLVSNRYAIYPVESEDLLSESLLRAVHHRNCPINVDVVKYVAEAIKSTAHSEKKLIRNRHELVPVNEECATQPSLPHLASSVEERLIQEQTANNIRSKILSLFDDDEIALLIAEGMMEEINGEELRELTKLDQSNFDSKRRLVRRRINKAFPQGWIA